MSAMASLYAVLTSYSLSLLWLSFVESESLPSTPGSDEALPDNSDPLDVLVAVLSLIFTGIDVIGDYLTEINVTSPTGIQELKRFGGADGAALIWDAIENRRK